MTEFDYQQLDDVIHSRIRLAAMAVLAAVDDAEFTFLRDRVQATDGNLGAHLKRLEDADYVAVEKAFVARKPVTRYRLTARGRRAFREYVKRIDRMLRAGQEGT
ncbi:MAG: transcriptional regulator [Gemmatimonadota bacterium]|nr:transcriptional regulator [Gemmatimonadota bacterium]